MTTEHGILQEGSPESVGMSLEVLERAGGVLERAVQDRDIGAASLTVGRRNTLVYQKGFGRQTPDPDAATVEPESIFLLASITKPVTACSLMLLVERGEISLGDPVSRYLPEFQGGERDQVKIRHLLSHSSGMPDMLPENVELRRAHTPQSEFVRRALKTPLLFTPNTQVRYQSKGILLAAEIVERLSGKRLRDFEEAEIFGPLGMTRSCLGMDRFELSDTVWCGLTKPESGDPASWGQNSEYWRNFGCPWGGMHSCGPDLAILLQTMLNGGAYGGTRVFSPATVASMTTNQNSPGLPPWGLGWSMAGSPVWNYFGELVSPVTFGHVGATGTVAWADPERDLFCVVLTNLMVAQGSLLRRVSNVVSAAVVE